jgi:predicted transcriptional regulator
VKRTTIYLPDSLKERVERVARDRNVSEAEVMRTAIDAYTKTASRPRPRLPLFESIGDPNLAQRVDEILAEASAAIDPSRHERSLRRSRAERDGS